MTDLENSGWTIIDDYSPAMQTTNEPWFISTKQKLRTLLLFLDAGFPQVEKTFQSKSIEGIEKYLISLKKAFERVESYSSGYSITINACIIAAAIRANNPLLLQTILAKFPLEKNIELLHVVALFDPLMAEQIKIKLPEMWKVHEENGPEKSQAILLKLKNYYIEIINEITQRQLKENFPDSVMPFVEELKNELNGAIRILSLPRLLKMQLLAQQIFVHCEEQQHIKYVQSLQEKMQPDRLKTLTSDLFSFSQVASPTPNISSDLIGESLLFIQEIFTSEYPKLQALIAAGDIEKIQSHYDQMTIREWDAHLSIVSSGASFAQCLLTEVAKTQHEHLLEYFFACEENEKFYRTWDSTVLQTIIADNLDMLTVLLDKIRLEDLNEGIRNELLSFAKKYSDSCYQFLHLTFNDSISPHELINQVELSIEKFNQYLLIQQQKSANLISEFNHHSVPIEFISQMLLLNNFIKQIKNEVQLASSISLPRLVELEVLSARIYKGIEEDKQISIKIKKEARDLYQHLVLENLRNNIKKEVNYHLINGSDYNEEQAFQQAMLESMKSSQSQTEQPIFLTSTLSHSELAHLSLDKLEKIFAYLEDIYPMIQEIIQQQDFLKLIEIILSDDFREIDLLLKDNDKISLIEGVLFELATIKLESKDETHEELLDDLLAPEESAERITLMIKTAIMQKNPSLLSWLLNHPHNTRIANSTKNRYIGLAEKYSSELKQMMIEQWDLPGFNLNKINTIQAVQEDTYQHNFYYTERMLQAMSHHSPVSATLQRAMQEMHALANEMVITFDSMHQANPIVLLKLHCLADFCISHCQDLNINDELKAILANLEKLYHKTSKNYLSQEQAEAIERMESLGNHLQSYGSPIESDNINTLFTYLEEMWPQIEASFQSNSHEETHDFLTQLKLTFSKLPTMGSQYNITLSACLYAAAIKANNLLAIKKLCEDFPLEKDNIYVMSYALVEENVQVIPLILSNVESNPISEPTMLSIFRIVALFNPQIVAKQYQEKFPDEWKRYSGNWPEQSVEFLTRVKSHYLQVLENMTQWLNKKAIHPKAQPAIEALQNELKEMTKLDVVIFSLVKLVKLQLLSNEILLHCGVVDKENHKQALSLQEKLRPSQLINLSNNILLDDPYSLTDTESNLLYEMMNSFFVERKLDQIVTQKSSLLVIKDIFEIHYPRLQKIIQSGNPQAMNAYFSHKGLSLSQCDDFFKQEKLSFSLTSCLLAEVSKSDNNIWLDYFLNNNASQFKANWQYCFFQAVNHDNDYIVKSLLQKVNHSDFSSGFREQCLQYAVKYGEKCYSLLIDYFKEKFDEDSLEKIKNEKEISEQVFLDYFQTCHNDLLEKIVNYASYGGKFVSEFKNLSKLIICASSDIRKGKDPSLGMLTEIEFYTKLLCDLLQKHGEPFMYVNYAITLQQKLKVEQINHHVMTETTSQLNDLTNAIQLSKEAFLMNEKQSEQIILNTTNSSYVPGYEQSRSRSPNRQQRGAARARERRSPSLS